MKILYLHPRAWSGEYSLLKTLRARGHEICVLEEQRNLQGSGRLLSNHFLEPSDDLHTFWYDPGKGLEKLLTWPFDRFFKRSFNGRNLAHRMWIIFRACAHFKPDVIVSSEGFAYGIPASFLKRFGLLRPKLMVSFIGGDILDCPEADVGKRRTPLTSWLIRQGLKSPDILRPVSPLLEKILIAEGADTRKIHVCPSHLPASLAQLQNTLEQKIAIRNTIRQRYQIPSDAPLIITLSGNQKGKGLHLLAEVWPKIQNALPGCHWLLCGHSDPWLEQQVLPALQRQNLIHTVTCIGSLTGIEVFEHLAAANLNVNPSLCESLNMVTVEAAAVGTPTITSNGAGIAAWIETYGCGLVVPADNKDALADAIIEFFKDNTSSIHQPEKCAALAQQFSLDRIADKLLALITATAK